MHRSGFTNAAKADLREAFEYYERKKPELGIEFMGRVRETVDRLEADPEIYPVLMDRVRRAPVSRFPFAVWYVFDGESVIIACLHTSRDPKVALKRTRTLGPGDG